ncbi:MAG: SCO family protein [Paracoccus sp. (in: a-proteobacteria)]|nr:SCO family protein [Paracoccus sp. (in: a-proteobacteria)]
MADRKLLMIGGAAAIGVLLGGGLFLMQSKADDPLAACRASTVAGGLDAFGTDFVLTRQDGARVTQDEVFTKPSLLYFGYTFCPDVCPLDVSRNAEVQELLAEKGVEIQNVFITVDPRRDTPEALAQFTSIFADDMIGLTGTEEEIKAVNQGWRNYYKINDEDDDEYYLVDHMTMTYLVMPGNKTIEFFPNSLDPEPMADRVGCFLEASS